MSITTTLLSKFTPYMVWIKIVLVLVVLGAVAYGGYSYGQATQHNADDVAYQKLEKEYNDDKIKWADTLAKADAEALSKLQEVEKKNAASEAAKQKTIDNLTVAYQASQKELKNAHQAAIDNVEHPHPSDNPVTDGLWVDADAGTCTFNKDGSDLVSEAAKGGLQSGSIRCRLSVSTATRLIDAATEANELRNTYNLCVKSLNEAVKTDDPVTTGDKDTQ